MQFITICNNTHFRYVGFGAERTEKTCQEKVRGDVCQLLG